MATKTGNAGYKINSLILIDVRLENIQRRINRLIKELDEHTTRQHNGMTLYYYKLNENNGRIETEERLDALNKQFDIWKETRNWLASIEA